MSYDPYEDEPRSRRREDRDDWDDRGPRAPRRNEAAGKLKAPGIFLIIAAVLNVLGLLYNVVDMGYRVNLGVEGTYKQQQDLSKQFGLPAPDKSKIESQYYLG